MATTTSTFTLKLGYIIYVIGTIISCSSCDKCDSSMDVDNKTYYNGPVIELQRKSYCFVNECTIRIKESDVLLNVINDTEGWLIVTNTTSLFTVVNDIMNSCSIDTGTNSSQVDTLSIIRIIIDCIGVIGAIATVIIHLMYKELRTVAGILIIIMSIAISCTLIVDLIWNAMANYHQIIKITTGSCLTFAYLGIISLTIYEATKTTVLIHFSYFMYRSYKLLGGQENVRSSLCKYITFIIGASMVICTTIITVDLTVNKRVYVTSDGQCSNFVWAGKENAFSRYNILLVASLLTWLIVQVILVLIGLLLYILTARRLLAVSTSRNLRIFIILAATIDLNIIIFVILLVTQVYQRIVILIITAVFGIEQFALFALFASSSKVRCCFMKEGKCFLKFNSNTN